MILQLYVHCPQPWSVTSLSEVLRHDRKTIRDVLRAFPEGLVVQVDGGYTLTERGQRQAELSFVRFVSSMDPSIRTMFRKMWPRGKPNPILRICEHSSQWANMATDTGKPMTQLMVMMVIYIWASGKWLPRSFIIERTSYSQSAVDMELRGLRKKGLIEMRRGHVKITSKGIKYSMQIVTSGVRFQNAKILKELWFVARNANAPQAGS